MKILQMALKCFFCFLVFCVFLFEKSYDFSNTMKVGKLCPKPLEGIQLSSY